MELYGRYSKMKNYIIKLLTATLLLTSAYGAYFPRFTDPVRQAQNVIFSTYGDVVSVQEKKKNLNKFGRNATVGTSFETIAEFQSTESEETYVSTNLIDSISSSSTSDTTQTIVVEGHTIDGSGNLTFVVQEKALTGQTEATLTTPLARATRAYVKATGTFNSYPAALVGIVYIYDNTGGQATGVPTNASQTKLTIQAGETQSQKASTSISAEDYWLIESFGAAIGVAGGSATRVEVRMEIRDVANGGAWRPFTRRIELVVGGDGVYYQFDNYLIVPKNHDFRIRAKCNSATAEVVAEASGVLAIVQE